MKATSEMVVNVCAQTGIAASIVQRVLDIALADVPDLSGVERARAMLLAHVRGDGEGLYERVQSVISERESSRERIAELEAQLAGEVCDGEHEGPCPAWHDGVDGLRQRIGELELQAAQMRAILTDSSRGSVAMCDALCKVLRMDT